MLIHEFRYKGNDLYCEGVRLASLVEKIGTPCYVYSYKTLVEHLEKLKIAFRRIRPLICYSVKAGSNLALIRALVKRGAGLDIVSGGELFRARKAGCPGNRMVFAGVGKSEREIRSGLRANIFLFNVESVPELDTIQKVAAELGKKQAVALRLNPDVGAGGHKYTTTGSHENKFGITFSAARQIFLSPPRWPNLDISGIHVHIGSQILTSRPFVEALKRTLSYMRELEKLGVLIRVLDLGGGLGIIYDKERPQTPEEYARKMVPLLKGWRCRIIFEPGRFIVGNSGVFLTRVEYIKRTPKKNFIVVDGAMNDLIRPALYGAYHDIFPVRRNGAARIMLADVVGPICETGDFLALNRRLPSVKPGDSLAVLSAGAYGFSMSSNYNSRTRAAEVLVKGNKFYVIRRRETYPDLVRGESIPGFLK